MNCTKWRIADKRTLQGSFMIMPKGSGGAIARVYGETNAKLILSAVNACIKLNPDNPMAVAEGISDLYEACRVTLANLDNGFANKNLSIKTMIKKALAKAEGK